STDDTPRVCDEIAALHGGTVRSLHRPNGGPGMARETGRLAARGEFIQYLDSDDRILPGKFEVQVTALSANPECDVAYGWTRYVRAGGAALPEPWKGSGRSVAAMFPSFLNERWWDTPTPLYRRCVTDAAGPWSDLRLEEDWEYDCRIASLGTRLAYCPEFVAEVRDHAEGRLCRGEALDPARLRERSRSHILSYGHARRFGIGPESPEMQEYARELFHLCRQCGSAGLVDESRELFLLAREASGSKRRRAWDFRLYSFASAVLGWKNAGALACDGDRLRDRIRSLLSERSSPLHLERGGRRPG
ncbi:MAG: glycosyltransferase family 2 protein, partial [Thermoanaerobaculia bacterium]